MIWTPHRKTLRDHSIARHQRTRHWRHRERTLGIRAGAEVGAVNGDDQERIIAAARAVAAGGPEATGRRPDSSPRPRRWRPCSRGSSSPTSHAYCQSPPRRSRTSPASRTCSEQFQPAPLGFSTPTTAGNCTSPSRFATAKTTGSATFNSCGARDLARQETTRGSDSLPEPVPDTARTVNQTVQRRR